MKRGYDQVWEIPPKPAFGFSRNYIVKCHLGGKQSYKKIPPGAIFFNDNEISKINIGDKNG